MKKSLWIILAMAVSVNAWANQPANFTPPKTSSELEEIKSLEGKWQGTAKEANGQDRPTTVEYRVTSGGSAVEEKLFTGTEHEMISMYHDVKGKLSMTHYCMLGNQPQLELKSSAAGKLELKESGASSALLAEQMRMGSLTLEYPDKNTLTQTWTAQDAEGKAMPPTVIQLKRV